MNDMLHIAKVLEKVAPDNWDSCGMTYESIVWKDVSKAIAESVINKEHALLLAAYPLQELRQKRNVLLASSDWTGLSDSALTNEEAAEWKLYRQKLRDLPDGLNTEAKVKAAKWPTKP
jgi:hypothetical protein